MIPGILEGLFDVRLFGYISFRAALAALTAFALALWWGSRLVPWLRRRKIGEDVSKTDDRALAEYSERMGKKGTPTMGGSFLVAALLAAVLFWTRIESVHVLLGVLLVAGLAAVGFADDWKKLTIPGCKGLSRRAKMTGLSVVVGAALALLAHYALTTGRGAWLSLYPPFFKDASIGHELLPEGALYVGLWVALWLAFEWLVIVGASNAVNVTDGMDGLAAGCLIISGLALSAFCYVSGRADWSGYLGIPFVAEAGEMAVVGAAMCGACMGFLWFNAYPAQVFMGDSGSLPLGGLLGWMALVSKQELVLPLIAVVFVLDLGSSWLQTFWFKHSGGRRVFTLAPIHHGLAVHGGVFSPGIAKWHEVQVVTRFWIVAALGALSSLALLKVR
jgi:phospho-N-acetylmuramoyl-pentapeptide-transferase